MMEYCLPVRVYIEDTDAGGIVYYVNYLKFMERARTEMLRSLGFDKAGANPGSTQFVVVAAQIDYRKPARLDDQLQVTAEVQELRGASLEFRQRVLRDGEVLCAGQIRIACVEGDSLRPARIDNAMRRALTEH